MKIFITGIAGFLGSHIAEAMLQDGHKVWGVDCLIGGDENNVPKGAGFFRVDCNNLRDLSHVMGGAEVVYHCAALAYEGLSVFSPHIVTQNIVGASVGVFSAATQCGVRRIVHCSSMARYGAVVSPFREYMTCLPRDPYGIGKYAVEQILRNLCEVHGMEYVIAVPHNIIGPRQKYDDPYRNVAAIMINRVLQNKPPIIYGDGNQRRCFSFVDDCLFALKQMGMSKFTNYVMNIGPDGQGVTINELASTILTLTGRTDLVPVHVIDRPQEVKTALCSSDLVRRMFNYKDDTPLVDGLQAMIHYIKAWGPKPFNYHLPIEIQNHLTPKTWTERLF